jgi:hypothetical protein
LTADALRLHEMLERLVDSEVRFILVGGLTKRIWRRSKLPRRPTRRGIDGCRRYPFATRIPGRVA